jgi:hypothetical protein
VRSKRDSLALIDTQRAADHGAGNVSARADALLPRRYRDGCKLAKQTQRLKMQQLQWVPVGTVPRRCQHESEPRMPSRADIEVALRHLAPRMPDHEFGAVVDHALDSGGLRTAAAETAAWLSLVAYVRHTLTDYDALLVEGYDRDSARFFVADDIRGILAGWGVRRPLTDKD